MSVWSPSTMEPSQPRHGACWCDVRCRCHGHTPQVRATEAELRMKEARAAQEAAEKRAIELEEALGRAARAAAQERADAAEGLALEVQRQGLERAKMQVGGGPFC